MNQRLSALWGGVLTNRWGRIALALLAGAGAALAHPPFGILPGLLGYPLLKLLAERSRTVSTNTQSLVTRSGVSVIAI